MALIIVAGTAVSASAYAAVDPADMKAGAILRQIALDTATEERILALAAERVSERDIEELLSRAAAPRVIALQGSFAVVTMQAFAEFLIAMGYPEERIRNPRDGTLSYSSFGDSEKLAGELAWYYETEGMVPILIGHSQGGMMVIRVLHELAGNFSDSIPVWNPLTDRAEQRTAIVDPVTGVKRPVVGLKVPYATAIATGKLPRLLLGQWTMLSRLRQVPDSVEEFTGFSILWDPIAGDFAGTEPYRATGSATVRNVALPATTSHVEIPLTKHLAMNAATRAWINAYVPGTGTAAIPTDPSVDTSNIVHAADIWYSVKKHWCLEAQRLIRAKRQVVGVSR